MISSFSLIELSWNADRVTVTVSGDVDIAALSALRAAKSVVGSGASRVGLDLSGVTFIDGSGLSGVMELAAEGTELEVVSMSPCVRRLLRALAGVGVTFPLREVGEGRLQTPGHTTDDVPPLRLRST